MTPSPFLFDLFDATTDPTTSNTQKPPSYLRDHRKRLRERFLKGGADAMPDYELLELILFRAIPRQDVKPLARRLIEVFGDFGSVIGAPADQLLNIKGVGDAVITEFKVVAAAAQRSAKASLMDRTVINSWSALVQYCRTTLAHRQTEQFRVLYLDQKNHLIDDIASGDGTINHAPVYPREVMRTALALNASALILVHNHPSGDPRPSAEDISTTRAISAAAEALGLTLHDHLIIGKRAEVSLRRLGHL